MRVIDAVFGFLLSPSVRRIRRWAFVVTVPAGVAIIVSLGLERGTGLVVVEALVVLLLVAVAAKLGGERAEVVLDFVMHPTARRAMRTELTLLWTIPDALLGGRRARPGAPFPYHHGSNELGFALALIPVAIVELVVVELLLPGSWFWVKVAIALLTVYGVLSLVSIGLGLRVYPHRLRDDTLEVRMGQLYRAVVPRGLIREAVQRRERIGDRTRLLLRDDEALLVVNGRVDVRLELAAPVVVERPFGDPAPVTAIAFAVDRPAELVRGLAPGEGAVASLEARRRG